MIRRGTHIAARGTTQQVASRRSAWTALSAFCSGLMLVGASGCGPGETQPPGGASAGIGVGGASAGASGAIGTTAGGAGMNAGTSGTAGANAGAGGTAGANAGAGGTAGANAGSGGTAGTNTGEAGAGGTTGAGAAGIAGANAGGGTAGANAGSGGVAGANAGSGGAPNGDMLPARPLAVTAAQARHQHTFRARAADPGVTFNDNTQISVLDNRASTLMGKLVLPFGGVGTNAGALTGGGEFCAKRGFHVLAIAAFQDYDIVSHGADFFGEARKQVFEGNEYTREGDFANVRMTPADGVAQRTQKALQYLHAMFPAEDWGYYLQADGSVRWSDVIFTGMSHGGSNAARFAMLVRASRVVSVSAPRENLCTRLDPSNCGGLVATWLGETPKTPIDRFYALTGKTDGQHLQHLFFMQELGYAGMATEIEGAEPPYGGSHRLVANAGHVDFCGEASYAAACNYMFGVPPENHAGTPP